MDPDYARAVLEVFVRLHEKGYIYRDHYLVNWSVGLQTAISDLEVEHHDVDDVLYEVAYPVEEGGEIRVATVRPITILADTAVAVHPDDERWRHLIGKTAIVPLVGRRVPIIADREVKPDFGTGALKITPGHDPVDFEIGRRHGLPTLTAIGFDGTMLDLRPDWEGLSAAHGGEAHERAVAELRETGALRGEEPYRHSVGHCSRSRGRIEPLVSLQWFCRMDELARPAIEAVREGRVRVPPEAQREDLPRLDGEHPALVHLAPALVGPPAARVVRARRLLRRADRAARGRGLGAVGRRARHVVLLGALALRHAGLARGHARAAHLVPGQRAVDGARHHQPLGRAHDHDRPRVPRRGAVHPRLHPLHDPGRRRAAHVEVAGHGRQPARPDRRVRRRRHALRPGEDVVHAGRALRAGRDRGGSRASRTSSGTRRASCC